MPSQSERRPRLWPLPRAVQLLLVPLLALISIAPSTVGAPLVPDVLNGFASATTFQIFGMGAAVEGGAWDWTDVCAYCLVRFTTTDGGILVADATHPDGPVRMLGPGQFEIREYRGLIGIYDLGLRNFQLELHGTGKTIQLS